MVRVDESWGPQSRTDADRRAEAAFQGAVERVRQEQPATGPGEAPPAWLIRPEPALPIPGFRAAVPPAPDLPVECKAPTAREREVASWVEKKVGGDDDGKVRSALQGKAEIGCLTGPEQAWLLDQVLLKWEKKPGDARTALDLAKSVKGDSAIRGVVADRLAVRAATLIRMQKGDQDPNKQRGAAITFAEAAVRTTGLDLSHPDRPGDAGQQRELVERLPPEQVGDFVEALSRRPQVLDAVASALAQQRLSPKGQERAKSFALGIVANARRDTFLGTMPTRLPQSLGRILSASLYPDDAVRQESETKRLGSIFASREGAELLAQQSPYPAQDDIPAEARARALAVIVSDPSITAERLGRRDGNPWSDPTIVEPMAQDGADQVLARSRQTRAAVEALLAGGRADGPAVPETLAGRALDERVAQAMNLPPEKGEVGRIAGKIREQGGEPVRVTVLPVQFSSPATGPVTLPLFRVDGADGKPRFVDNQGAQYGSFQEWETKSILPPGNMTYPRGGELRPGSDGHVALDTRNTPKTPDTAGEKAAAMLDRAALVGGILAFGGMTIGSGGALAFVAGGLSAAWIGGRAEVALGEREARGLPTGMDDPEARMLRLNAAAGLLGGLPMGRLAYLSTMGRSLQLNGGWRFLAGASMVADAGAAGNLGHTLATRWDEMSPGQRFEVGFGLAFWGGATGAALRPAGRHPASNDPAVRAIWNGDDAVTQFWSGVGGYGGRPKGPPPEHPSTIHIPTAKLGPQVEEAPASQPTGQPRVAGAHLDAEARLNRLQDDLQAAGHKGATVASFAEVRSPDRITTLEGEEMTAVQLFREGGPFDGEYFRGDPIVLNLQSSQDSAREFAQSLANKTGNDVYIPKGIDWEKLAPKSEVSQRASVPADASAEQIKAMMGPFVNDGGYKTVWRLGKDEVVIIFKRGDMDEAQEEMKKLELVRQLGFPVPTQTGKLMVVDGHPAVRFKAYSKSNRDIGSEDGEIENKEILTRKSIDSLEEIAHRMKEKGVAFDDMEFLIDKDGEFYLWDFGEILTPKSRDYKRTLNWNMKIIYSIIASAK